MEKKLHDLTTCYISIESTCGKIKLQRLINSKNNYLGDPFLILDFPEKFVNGVIDNSEWIQNAFEQLIKKQDRNYIYFELKDSIPNFKNYKKELKSIYKNALILDFFNK